MKKTINKFKNRPRLSVSGEISKVVLVEALVISCVSVLLFLTYNLTSNGLIVLNISLLIILTIYYKKIILEIFDDTKEAIILSNAGFITVKDYSYFITFLSDLGVFYKANIGGDTLRFSEALNKTLKTRFKTAKGSLKEVRKGKVNRKDYSKFTYPLELNELVKEDVNVIISALINTEYTFEKNLTPIVVKEFDAERLKILAAIYISTYHLSKIEDLSSSENEDLDAKTIKPITDSSIQVELDFIIKKLTDDKFIKHKKK